MDLVEHFNRSPFRELVGIEITDASEGRAAGELSLERKHSSNRQERIAQGGVTFTLADSVGGAAVVSLCGRPTPTIDFRIDYFAPAIDDLVATAEVVRDGSETSVVEVVVEDVSGTTVATGTGVYKTSGLPEDAPWNIDAE